MASNDFSSVTFGQRVTKPVRTVFGVLALFENEHRGQFFLKDGTPIGPPHQTMAGAIAYAAKKGWKVEPADADEMEEKEEPTRPSMPTVPDAPVPKVTVSETVEVPSRVRPKPPRRKMRGK